MPQNDSRSITIGAGAWRFGGLTKKQLAQRTWHEFLQDRVLGRSAQLAYFFLFAIFPLVIFLTALIGVIIGTNSATAHHLIARITQAMPASAGGLVRRTIRHSLSGSGGGKMAFGIVVALFSASSGMAAMIETLNAVFDVRDERSFLNKRFTALWLTVAAGLLVCVAIFLITVGGKVAAAVVGGALYWIWQCVQYPLAALFLLIAFSLIYRFAPNVQGSRWRIFTPGSVAGLCLWLLVSFGLRLYLHRFNTYTSDYGTMGAVMVLMLWFYLTAMAFLAGAELDAVIARAATNKVKHGNGTNPAHDARPGRAA